MTRNADYVLVPALLIGLLGDLLFKVSPPFGINLTLWIVTLIIVTNYCIYKRQFSWNNHNRIFSWAACVFALCLSWRDSTVLQWAGWFGLSTSVFLASTPIEEFKKRITQWFLLFTLPLDGFISVLKQAFTINKKKEKESPTPLKPVYKSILLGTVMAVPLLMLFSSMMASADQLFESFVVDKLDLDALGMIGHLFRWGSCTILAAFLILLWGKKKNSFERKSIPYQTSSLGPVELTTILFFCNGLFITFVVIQVSYLFGSHEWIQTTAEHSYAEYARRGFFELCGLVSIVIPMLLLFDWILTEVPKHDKKFFQWLSGGLVCQLFVIIFSALHRMSLYMEQYGLTQLRVYVAVFLVWLFGALIWFLFTIFRGQQPRFIQGITYYGLAGVFVLFLVNPDYQIMNYNVNRAAELENFDAAYAQGLSLDAVPALERLDGEEGSEYVNSLIQEIEPRFRNRTENIPLLSMTWSRYRARAHLMENE